MMENDCVKNCPKQFRLQYPLPLTPSRFLHPTVIIIIFFFFILLPMEKNNS